MGTNYYAHIHACPSCHKSDEKLHIGKRSAGWKFLWRGYNFKTDEPFLRRLDTKARWVKLLQEEDTAIYDEYGRLHGLEEFLDMLTEWKQNPRNTESHFKASMGSSVEDVWMDSELEEFFGREFC